MKKDKYIFLLYLVPYVYLAMAGDALLDTVLIYGVMLLAFVGLCLCCIKTRGLLYLIAGNVASFMTSYGLSRIYDIDKRGYFKPFTATGLIIVISVGIIILQGFIIMIYKRKKS